MSSSTGVYVMTLAKYITQTPPSVNDASSGNGYTVFGFYDRVMVEPLNQFDNLLDIEHTLSSDDDILTRKISLFDSNPTASYLDMGVFFKDKISLVCMTKLNARTFFNSNPGSTNPANAEDALEIIKNEIVSEFVKLGERDSKYDNVDVKILFSLSVYDIVLFIQHPDPSIMAQSFLHIKQTISKLAFSTSFFVVDFSGINAFENLYGKVNSPNPCFNVDIRIKFTLKRTAKLDELKKVLNNQLSLINNNFIIGHTPGDTDVIFAAQKVPLAKIIALYSQLNDENTPFHKATSRLVKNMQSSFAFFEPEFNIPEDTVADVTSKQRLSEGIALCKAVQNKYNQMQVAGEIPVACQSTIVNFFRTFNYLYQFRGHHDAVIKFLHLMDIGLDAHKAYLNNTPYPKNTTPPAIIDFVFDLHFSIRNIASAGTIYMDRMLELHPMNPYAKLFYSYEQIASRIFYSLPHSKDSQINIKSFVMMNHKMELSSKQYFANVKNNTLIVAIEIPHPQFFSLRKSFVFLLHELSHYCQGGLEREKVFNSIVLGYIAIEMYADKYDNFRQNNKISKRKWNKLFDSVNELFENACLVLNDNLKLSDILSYMVGLRVIDNAPEVCSAEISDDIFNVIKDFACDNYLFIEELDDAFSEAIADVLMLEMADSNDIDKLLKYVTHLSRYFNENFINPLSGSRKKVFAFVRRCFFVLSFYGHNFESTLEVVENSNIVVDEKNDIIVLFDTLSNERVVHYMVLRN